MVTLAAAASESLHRLRTRGAASSWLRGEAGLSSHDETTPPVRYELLELGSVDPDLTTKPDDTWNNAFPAQLISASGAHLEHLCQFWDGAQLRNFWHV
jgi:hypothetical protein